MSPRALPRVPALHRPNAADRADGAERADRADGTPDAHADESTGGQTSDHANASGHIPRERRSLEIGGAWTVVTEPPIHRDGEVSECSKVIDFTDRKRRQGYSSGDCRNVWRDEDEQLESGASCS